MAGPEDRICRADAESLPSGERGAKMVHFGVSLLGMIQLPKFFYVTLVRGLFTFAPGGGESKFLFKRLCSPMLGELK